jgi:plasmid stabilization system protein ParE
MTYKVKITARAKKAYEQNLDYLHKEWGNKVALKFIERVDKMIGIIQENPFCFQFIN